MKTLRLLLILFTLSANSFSQIGKNGNVTITNTQVVNEYTYLQTNAAPGDLNITVNNSGLNTLGTFGGPLSAGDLIMIIQMQGATILGGVNNISWGQILNYNNCGLYEFKEVASVPNATHIQLTCPLENSYSQQGHVQVIRVPRYNTLTVDGGTITSLPWNGLRGGIVAIEVYGLTNLINGGKIDVTGQGFRGGIMDNVTSYGALMFASNSQNDGGEKGESIAGFGPDYAPLGGRYGRGAPANGGGGGNAHNAGGGGGSNAGNEFPWNGLGNPDNSNPAWTNAWNLEGGTFSANMSSGGGRGGYTFSMSNQNALILGPNSAAWAGDTRRNTGGIGGRPLDYNTGRLFVGGGGGAGDGNNGAGTNGASGGGMVYLLTYNDIVGTGQIIASGQTAPTTPPNGNDAPGGGGGGGTIVIASSGTVANSITLLANGGDGGDQFILSNEAEGPGGGGGGGYITYSGGTPTSSVLGGANGTTNSLGVTEFIPNGATAGGNGIVSSGFTSPFNMNIVALDDSICIGTSTTLTANAEMPSYTSSIQWFTAPFGGTLLATGGSYTTPNLFGTTTYYLKVCPSLSVDSVTVTVQNNPVFNVTTTPTSCSTTSDGTAQANGLLNTYTYLWSNGQNGTSATGLPSGVNSVTATTSLGCQTTVNFNLTSPPPMLINFASTPALCYNQASGSLQANANGGAAPYNYQWVSPAVSGNTINNVPAGTYTVNVTDGIGCVVSANGTITNPQPLTATITSLNNVSCNGGTNGSVNVSILGGNGPYTIDWLTLSNDANYMDNLAAGNYVAEITDANGCLATVVATISEPAPFTAAINILNNESCSNGNGSAFATTNGGIGALTYSWTPNVSSINLAMNLSAGPIQVIVQDENGCSASANGSIINNATGIASIGSISPVTCVGNDNGSVTVNMTGGTAPFNYAWSCICPNSNTANNLAAGNYSVMVTDYYGCQTTLGFTINQIPELILDTVAIHQPLCHGDNNGSIEVAATGGTTPFFFAWNTMPAQYNSLATSLAAGNYSVIVNDSNGCSDTLTFNLNQPQPLTLTTQVVSNILCAGDSAGVIGTNVTGGTQPYQYAWSNGSTVDTLTQLIAGSYTVTITDDNGCAANGGEQILEYHYVTAEIIADSLFCPGDLVNFYVSTNGMNNLYDYNWYVNGTLQSTQNTYTIPVYTTTLISIALVNQVNCPTVTDSVVVSPITLDPGILSVIGTTDTICLGNQGMVMANISNWAYITNVYWSEFLGAGVGPHLVNPTEDHYYVVTVENVCNQTIEDSVKLNVFLPPAANIYAWDTKACDEVNAQFGFDFEPYDYSLTQVDWTFNGSHFFDPSPIVNFTQSADIIAHLGLTFSNGCTFDYSDSIEIEVWERPEANFYYNPIPAMQYELTEFIDISHGNPKEWEWYVENQFISTDERTTHVFTEQGNYAVMMVITNEYGCTDTAHLLIEVIGDYTVYVPNAFTPDGNG